MNKKFEVTIALIIGYKENTDNEPKLRYDRYIVDAENEKNAIKIAKECDKTFFTVWEIWAEEV